jgi:hypothetical protein
VGLAYSGNYSDHSRPIVFWAHALLATTMMEIMNGGKKHKKEQKAQSSIVTRDDRDHFT